MKGDSMLIGVIMGMKNQGAQYVKTDATHIFFIIPKGCNLDDDEALSRAAKGIRFMTGKRIKVKRLN